MTDFVFRGSKNHCRWLTAVMKLKDVLLLGRKAMTNLDSVLKSNDITLLTKVCLVKAMVFPVVMYGCEIGTILESPLDSKEIQPINLKGDNPEYSLEGLMLKL